MKKLVLSLILFCFFTAFSYSQDFTYAYGLKGGINYTMGGSITGNSHEVGGIPVFWVGTAEAQGKIGYHGGAFFQLNYGKIFIRPEVTYSSIKTEYEFPRQPSTHDVQKIDIPLLFGYNIFGPLDLYAGPVYSNIIDSSIMADDNGDPMNVVAQNSPINFQVGTKLEFGRFGVDVRYEHTLSPAESHGLDFINSVYGVNLATFNDPRINQIIVSLTFKIGGTGIGGGGGRRGGGCY